MTATKYTNPGAVCRGTERTGVAKKKLISHDPHASPPSLSSFAKYVEKCFIFQIQNFQIIF